MPLNAQFRNFRLDASELSATLGLNTMQRLAQISVVVALFLPALGCSEWSSPVAFESQRERLQAEWKAQCDEVCSGTTAPSACEIAGDAVACSAYNESNASACLDLYERVIRRDICAGNAKEMLDLGRVCDAVYIDCVQETEGTGGESGLENVVDGTPGGWS